jgi:hypothetical protein
MVFLPEAVLLFGCLYGAPALAALVIVGMLQAAAHFWEQSNQDGLPFVEWVRRPECVMPYLHDTCFERIVQGKRYALSIETSKDML